MVHAFKLAPGDGQAARLPVHEVDEDMDMDSGMTAPQQNNIIIHKCPKVENAVMSPRAPENPTTRRETQTNGREGCGQKRRKESKYEIRNTKYGNENETKVHAS